MTRKNVMPPDEDIIAYHDEGMSPHQISRIFGVGSDWVRKRLKLNDIEPNVVEPNSTIDKYSTSPWITSDENRRRQLVYEKSRKGAKEALDAISQS